MPRKKSSAKPAPVETVPLEKAASESSSSDTAASLTHEQKKAAAFAILESQLNSDGQLNLPEEEPGNADTEETVEGEPIPLEIANEPDEPEQGKEVKKEKEVGAGLMRFLGRMIDEDAAQVSSSEEDEGSDDARYVYTNFASCVDVRIPLRRGETPEELLEELAAVDAKREWRSRSEILEVFNYDNTLDELSLAATLSEIGIGLEVVGEDKYLAKVWTS